jgi:hypothetical protein
MPHSEGGPFLDAAPDPEMTLDIRLAQGSEAQRLRIERARVIAEVVAWAARKRSGNGSPNTAA